MGCSDTLCQIMTARALLEGSSQCYIINVEPEDIIKVNGISEFKELTEKVTPCAGFNMASALYTIQCHIIQYVRMVRKECFT